MTTEELAQVWVPVSLRWRHVVEGDVVIGGDGAPWAIVDVDHLGTWVARSGRREYQSMPDPDDVIEVLVPALERDAVELTREELGARLVARRTMEQG
jgi:hypothetical protein